MLFSKNSGKFPDPFEKNTSADAHNTVPIPGTLKDHSASPGPASESNGDIYYSTFLRLVKPFSEDFSNFLRSGPTCMPPERFIADAILRRTPAFFKTDII